MNESQPMSQSAVMPGVVYQHNPAAEFYSEREQVRCGHCHTAMEGAIESDVDFLFCPQCKRPDTQAFAAITHAFTWLQAHEPDRIDPEPHFGEFVSWLDPLKRPPVAYSYIRLWQFSYDIANEIVGKEQKAVLVALLPNGTYRSELNQYPRCWDIPLLTTCGNYLWPNERGVLACPEHGEYQPLSLQGGA